MNYIYETSLFFHFFFTLLLLIIIKIDYKRYDKILDAKYKENYKAFLKINNYVS